MRTATAACPSQPCERATIVGRDAELAALERWLGSARPALLELEGEAGIGKTVLWEEGVRAAREAGARVLACRPVEIETAVAYGALASLLEPALAVANGAVPPPRRRALEGALRLRDVPASSLDETAVALGALSVLRGVAEQQPVVVAVDDVPVARCFVTRGTDVCVPQPPARRRRRGAADPEAGCRAPRRARRIGAQPVRRELCSQDR